MPIYIIILFFVAATLVLFFLALLILPKKTALEQRLEHMTPQAAQGGATVLEGPPGAWHRFLSALGRKIPVGKTEEGKYTRTLIAAGIKGERLPVFLGFKIFLAVALPVAYVAFYGLPVQRDLKIIALFASALAITGFLIPSVWLTRKVKHRQVRIFHDLPDVLDLMTICVEAGLSLDAAMIRISDDPQFKESPLVGEMRIATQETRAGKPRLDALRDMGERTMVDDLKAFAAMLIQTEKLGTSLAQSLRIHSDSLRLERKQMAEEAAAKTSVKLLFPLVFFIFPPLLVVILGPGFIRLLRTLQ